MKLLPGKPYPLGATWDGQGVNFALFSENAQKVELCLFENADAGQEFMRFVLPEKTHAVWHGYLRGVVPGQLYGYRIYGTYSPRDNGNRFNPNKVLLDPYAKGLGRTPRWNNSLFAYRMDSSRKDLVSDKTDNAPFAPLAAVMNSSFDWGNDRPLRTPWHETVIYEAHIKGMTQLHPRLPAHLRGTYAGLASDEVISHLKDLGVTAVELLPVHVHADEPHLLERGLTNYWGYNTLNFFIPDPRYASEKSPEGVLREFKGMVRRLHEAGLEVILDVVYNHTAEGNHLGPTYSLRGIDNASYYRLVDKKPRYYEDFSGCGNSLNMRHPRALQLMMDSLRYWVNEVHVDGFRFDLASALARELYAVDKLGGFFDVIHQDPVISQTKLIAEPWDLGEGGYQVGEFPAGWVEWNGRYRDVIRGFWKGEEGVVSEFATRFCGSSDLYEDDGRHPSSSINFITCHDGFTMQDLVTYEEKHNEANREENKDGENHNRSWNCGHEGPTGDPKIVSLREQQKRNLAATLLLSHGVPMISGGDEFSRSQLGNNNAYCQDNELSWYRWDPLNDNQRKYLEFVKRVIWIRKTQPVFRRRNFFRGRSLRRNGIKDIMWFEPSGKEMDSDAWRHYVRCLGIFISGDDIGELDAGGDVISGPSFMLLLNAYSKAIDFRFPDIPKDAVWSLVLDTAEAFAQGWKTGSGNLFNLNARSLAVFQLS